MKGSMTVNSVPLMKQKCRHNRSELLGSRIFKELSAEFARITWIKCCQVSHSLECVTARVYLHQKLTKVTLSQMVPPNKRSQKVKLYLCIITCSKLQISLFLILRSVRAFLVPRLFLLLHYFLLLLTLHHVPAWLSGTQLFHVNLDIISSGRSSLIISYV